jgi:hypothetical protein
MAEYINIRGQNIEVVASDPANPTLGQIWYNSTSNTLKGQGFAAASWATGGTMGTARYLLAGAGTQTAALGFGGYTWPPATYRSETEEYNGSAWTAGGSLNTARWGLAAAGTQTATLGFGGTTGSLTGATEEYNGSTWTTSPGSMATARNKFSRSWNNISSISFWWLYSCNSSNRRI